MGTDWLKSQLAAMQGAAAADPASEQARLAWRAHRWDRFSPSKSPRAQRHYGGLETDPRAQPAQPPLSGVDAGAERNPRQGRSSAGRGSQSFPTPVLHGSGSSVGWSRTTGPGMSPAVAGDPFTPGPSRGPRVPAPEVRSKAPPRSGWVKRGNTTMAGISSPEGRRRRADDEQPGPSAGCAASTARRVNCPARSRISVHGSPVGMLRFL